MTTATKFTLTADNRTAAAFRQVKADLSSVRGGLDKVGKAAAGFALAAGAGFAAITAQRFAAIDSLAKVADSLKVGTEQLRGFQLAGELTGVTAGTLNTGLQKLTRQIGEAARAPGAARDAIQALGLSIGEVAELDAAEQFKLIADRVSGLSTQSEKAAVSSALFGRAGVDLLNTLELGADGLDAITDQARRYGTALSRVDAKQIENANDAITLAKEGAAGLGNTIAVAVSPFVQEFANRLSAAALESDGFSSQVEKGMNIAVQAIGIAADAAQFLAIGLKAINVPLTALISLARLAGATFAGEFTQGLSDAAAAIDLAKAGLVDAATAPKFSDAVKSEFDKIRADAAAARVQIQADIDAAAAQNTASTVTVPGFQGAAAEKQAITDTTKELSKLRAEAERVAAATRTPLENYLASLETLKQLRQAFPEIIDAETYQRQVQGLAETFRDLEVKAAESLGSVAETGAGAAQDLQGAFRGWLNNTESGIKGLGQVFAQVIQKMAADYATSAIFGIFGSLLGFPVTPLFAPGRALGGPVAAGRAYTVGESGPELFIPAGAGRIEPNAGGTVNVYNNVDARGADPSSVARMQQALDANRRQTIAEIRDLKIRGRL